ncbi:fibrosin-1-like protein isoform X5 [Rana temporaria]|uniref:fibrosin-1-like protein isoform X5 n=1 Tax=Rana temporaria TaxID=8407 RepID=UPI001AAD124F|nr:fibrosin-1-like protein isoform X5 [Rana temporaria]
MDVKMKQQSRRSRSQRDRVRRRDPSVRDPRNQSPSSASEAERGLGKENSNQNGKNPVALARNTRPPRRKRRESSSQEEDLIDGFAIASFNTLEALEKDLALKPPERKEKWERHPSKKSRASGKYISAEPSENGHNHDAGSSEREMERGKERDKKKYPLKAVNQVKASRNRNGRNSEESSIKEAMSSQRSSSHDRLSDSSAQSLSGHGYSCDSESDINDKCSNVGSEILFSPAVSTGLGTLLNDKSESQAPCHPKVSGLERSQELNTEVLYIPPIHSPPPPPAAIVTSASSTPASSTRASPLVKKEPTIVAPAPPRLTPQPQPRPQSRPLSQPQLLPIELRTQNHISSHLNYPGHQQLPQNGITSISRSSSASSAASISIPKHLPSSPQIPPHHPAGSGLPLSISNLATSHFALRSQTQHHPAMFATPPSLPPPPSLPTNGLVIPGHPAGAGYSDTSLLISFNQPIMYCQPHSGILIGTLSQASLLPPPMSPHVENHHSMTCRNRECQFDKYAPKLDSSYFRHSNFFPTYTSPMPGMPPMLPHSGPFSSLQGAFQPKTSNAIDVTSRPGAVHHTLLQKTPGVNDPYRTPVRKPGKWCAVHVQIAWQIYHHQQKMKQMQMDPHKLDICGKLDLFSRPPAPGVFPGIPYPHDLARPLFSSTGPTHPGATPFGPSPHHSSFLPTSHLAGKYPFSRSSSFSGLGNLGSNAFGGLASHALTHNSLFAHKESPTLQTFSSPHEPWNRLHRTPPSFPTPPQWSKVGDSERSSSVTNHDRDKEDKRELSLTKDERDKERDLLDKSRHHSNRSSPASAPVSHQISNLIRSNSQTPSDSLRQGSLGDRSKEIERENADRLRDVPSTEHKIKESRSPVKEPTVHDKRTIEDGGKPVIQSVSPYGKPVLSESLKLSNLVGKDSERKPELPTDLQKIKSDVKVKEERKEDSDVLVVGSEPPHPVRTVEHQPLPPQSSLHGLSLHHTMAASMQLPMGSVHQMNNLNMLDRSRVMTPLMGMGHLTGRERLPHASFAWDPVRDPLRDAYRTLDLQRRMDFHLRADGMHRYPGTAAATFYDHERSYRDREPHDYSHEQLLEARREQERLRHADERERERLHLREEIERARMHHLHSSPLESHLAHMPSFMPHLSGVPYPRLSPSGAMHNGILNRTPPTAALSAPPPLVPASNTRPASPRRTNPLTSSEARDFSPSRNPKEVEAR